MSTADRPRPDDLLQEGGRARKLLSGAEGVQRVIESLRLVDDAILAHVLMALWESGFYEYALAHSSFRAAEAAEKLRLDPRILGWLLDHLVGRGILQAGDDGLRLTARGSGYFNVLCRGSLNLYLGGYGALLSRLGPLLRKEIALSDPATVRSGHHAAVGSEQLSCVWVVPAALRILARRGSRKVLDLGCGAGGFLIQLAQTDASARGVGVDQSPEAIEQARRNARRFGVDDRLKFVRADVGADLLPEGAGEMEGVDAITAMYLFHEFGRDGREKIVEVLRGIRRGFPGRCLVFAECHPPDVRAMAEDPPASFSPLDYLLIHPLSRQGPPLTPAEWKAILEEAGIRLLELREIHWIGLYVSET
jgi:SAM-dependent methyltransferase